MRGATNPFADEHVPEESIPKMNDDAPEWSDDKPDTPLLPAEEKDEEKKGHKFFGLCCDSRRAVIIVNSLSLVIFICGLIAAIVPGSITVGAQNIVAMLFNLLFTVVIIGGAMKFNQATVFIGLLWELFIICYWITGATRTIENFDWSKESPEARGSTIAFVVISIIWQFVNIYAEVVFVYETHQGIMTPETYKREEQSCCCV
ncbi:hypothetical protein ACHAWT_001409 [Skeletonema menzelii]|eukprot:scaffold5857_cov133-Skeletonema_menzelii.AAC.2